MKIITTLCAILLYCIAYSQEWSNLQSNETFSIDFTKVIYDSSDDGIKHERIVFQYTNLTNSDITLSFQRLVSYDNNGTLNPQERTYQVLIPANSSIRYNDYNLNDKTFYLFSKDLKGAIERSLTNFEIININTL